MNHKLWGDIYDQKQDNVDSAAMFLSQSQPGAGDAYNCLPGICPATNWPSSDVEMDLQRRLRIPLFPPVPEGHDEMGDSLQNAGEHTTRHNAALGPVARASYRYMKICDISIYRYIAHITRRSYHITRYRSVKM